MSAGEALAGSGTFGGELVFTAGMGGYQEVVTDPSCHDQLVAFTFPLVGNCGVHPDRNESDRVHARAAIARETKNSRFNAASSGAGSTGSPNRVCWSSAASACAPSHAATSSTGSTKVTQALS
jgi:hypothetical protein